MLTSGSVTPDFAAIPCNMFRILCLDENKIHCSATRSWRKIYLLCFDLLDQQTKQVHQSASGIVTCHNLIQLSSPAEAKIWGSAGCHRTQFTSAAWAASLEKSSSIAGLCRGWVLGADSDKEIAKIRIPLSCEPVKNDGVSMSVTKSQIGSQQILKGHAYADGWTGSDS